MTTSETRLSVVIAAYDAESTLGAQLEALSRQEAPFAWEVIVSDNGSTDATARLARSWGSRLPRLDVVDSSGIRGPAAARNIGAAAASGRALAFCDADDVVAPGWVAAMGAALEVDAIVTGTSRRPELGSRPHEGRTFTWSRYVAPFFPQLPGAGAGNLAVDAELFRELGGFDIRLGTGEDVDLCWRAQLAGHHLGHAPEAIVDVANRAGLMATFRQHFHYGAGNRLLLAKYADVIDAYADLPPWEPPRTPSAPEREQPQGADGLVARGWRKLRRLRGPRDLTHLASRAGYRAGRRWGRTPEAIAPEPVPPGGPTVP